MITLFENFLNNKTSTKSGDLYIKLSKKFDGKVKLIEHPTGQYRETIDIYIFKNDENIIQEIKKFIHKHNWYSYNTDTKIKNTYRISINPIYSEIYYEEIPDVLYHTTPEENIPSILKYGLKSKSEDIRHKYPPRIYLSDYKGQLYPLIKELKRWKKPVPYCILEIDTKNLNLTLYNDQTSGFKGNCYIQNTNIPPNHIKVIETDL